MTIICAGLAVQVLVRYSVEQGTERHQGEMNLYEIMEWSIAVYLEMDIKFYLFK